MSSYVAGKVAAGKAESMLAPLLESDEESGPSSAGGSETSSEVEKVKRTPMQKLKSLVVYAGLGLGTVASVGAAVLYPAMLVFVMGGICVANVPYAFMKESRIGKIPSLRAMNNRLRETSNELTQNVDELAEEIDALEPEADRASELQKQLEDIAGRQQVNVDRLVELVKENETILVQMRENLRQRIVQDMITIVVKSDKDNDQKIDKVEAKTLALSIRLQLQEYDVVFDPDKFIKAIGANPSVQGVIEIVQKLMPSQRTTRPADDSSVSDSDDETDDEDQEDDDLYDMFHMSKERCPKGTEMSLMTCDKNKNRERASLSSRLLKQRSQFK